ncbi:MAG: histidine kinase [Bacteroidota bacterium]
MKPITNIPRWAQHLIFWLELIGWYYLQYVWIGGKDDFGLRLLVILPVDMLAAYFSAYVLFDRGLRQGKYGQFFVFLLVSALFFAGLSRFLEYQFLLSAEEQAREILWRAVPIFNQLVRIYLVVSLFVGARLFKIWLQDQQRKQDLQQQSLSSELAMLRAQVQPHFLFNTLNNIDSLVHIDPEKASEAIANLSAILRFQLYDKSGDMLPVSEEIRLLRSTLALLDLRRTGETKLKLEMSSAQQALYMPALLLAPIVENAYKHGDKQAAIVISLWGEGEQLFFEVRNQRKKTATQDLSRPGGIGLANVKRRLELYFGDQYQLEYGPQGPDFVVSLQIPLLKEPQSIRA